MTAPSPPGVPGRRRSPRPCARPLRPVLALLLTTLLLTACSAGSSAATGPGARPVLTVGAIPDQDPQRLQRLHGLVAAHLEAALDVDVEYRPVTDYAAAVSLFRTGDLQLVWFGGLTGVQARLQTPGAVAVAQRDVDRAFHSLFLGHVGSGIAPFDDVAGLAALEGRRFVFGSQSSTSGYLMPAWFLREAGVDPRRGFDGEPGLSGSHDRTIDLVASGTYDAGVVNEQVWQAREQAGTVDTTSVEVLFRTPPYADYHWVLGPTALEQHGRDLPARLLRALQDLDASDPDDAAVLELFGAERFVPVDEGDHDRIEQVGRELGLVSGP